MLRTRVGLMAVAGLLVAGCTGQDEPAGETAGAVPAPGPTTADSSAAEPAPSTDTTTPVEPAAPVRFRASAAMRTVRQLALGIGPRQATSAAYAEAAEQVQREFERWGYQVRRQDFRAPAGNSWGIDVPGGPTRNLIATTPGFDATRPHRIVGAHLDTVPQAPGAEDNASGVAVVLELARMAAAEPPPVPVMFVAFGAEEPRGPGDDWHHFGSRTMVERLDREQRRALVGMVSLDRVGVGREVPVSTGGLEPPVVRSQLMRAAKRVDVPAFVDEANQSSDHWSFDKAGLPSARLGSTPYAGYHSAGDVPAVVSQAQLDRVGQLIWAWLGTAG